jgi:hypothetical protein
VPVHRADQECAVRQREVRRGRLAPRSGPAVPLQELRGERAGQRPGRLAPVGLAPDLDAARVPFRLP